jgi:uncharacterized membrane protein
LVNDNESTFFSDWYKATIEALDRYQQELLQVEEATWENQRKKYVEELKPELDELEKICRNARDYKPNSKDWAIKMYGVLEAIYKRFPPKDSKFKVVKVEFPDEYTDKTKKSLKKAYQQATTHYHPDRQKEKDGLKWKVLSEEICKELTNRYENFKGIDD